MFCPTCGRKELDKPKFCRSCGTNLEKVTNAISPIKEGVMARIDKSLDRLIARYAGRFFKNAPAKALDRRVAHSWQIFGQGILAFLMNLILLPVMWFVVLPVRFLVLLLYTPSRLLSEWAARRRQLTVGQKETGDSDVHLSPSEKWSPDSVASVTEHTTVDLSASSERPVRSRTKL